MKVGVYNSNTAENVKVIYGAIQREITLKNNSLIS